MSPCHPVTMSRGQGQGDKVTSKESNILQRRGALTPGLLLILFGAWLLAQNLGVPLPGLDMLWPALPLLFGLGLLLQFFPLGRLRWGDMDRYWPVFVLIGGLAFLAQWLVNPAQRGLLIPAGLGLLVGLVAITFTLNLASPALIQQVTKLWPLALIVLGLSLLASYFFRENPPR